MSPQTKCVPLLSWWIKLFEQHLVYIDTGLQVEMVGELFLPTRIFISECNVQKNQTQFFMRIRKMWKININKYT